MYQVGSACYSTPTAAVQAIASAQTGAVVQHGGAAYVVIATGFEGGVNYSLHPVAGGPVIGQIVALTPEPCGLLTASDAAQMAWMVAAAWIGVYAVMFLARVLRGETTSSYGDT